MRHYNMGVNRFTDAYSNAKGSYSNRSAEMKLPQFWQRRFYDFDVWSAAKRREKLEYMHRNPIRRRLVEDPKDWT